VGYAKDLKLRFGQHKKGHVQSTKDRLPLRLIYYEACIKQEDALNRERYLKTYNGKRFTNYLGNHWSVYTEPDLDGDGLGELPFMIDPVVPENPELRDYYPLVEPLNAYSNLKKGGDTIPGFNLILLLGIIGIVIFLKVITKGNYKKMLI